MRNALKSLGKRIVCMKLEQQVKHLRQQHPLTVIAVVGSVGKTSTKAAIAQVLGTTKKVLYQQGNYNDRVTVPLIFFNESLPPLWNAWAWFRLLRRNQQQIHAAVYAYDTVVVELGTDGPGQIAQFAYVAPDITVVTALTAEHMEYFGSIDAVAAEELAATQFSKTVLINSDDADPKYLAAIQAQTYSVQHSTADFYATVQNSPSLQGQTLSIHHKTDAIRVSTRLLGMPGAKTVLAAVSVAKLAGLSDQAIVQGIAAVQSFPGRLQVLAGIKQSTLLDDTYNASPAAMIAALDVLQAAEAPQRIAILGSMNEMGAASEAAHRLVGAYCDPAKLSQVITIGAEANEWLALAAREKGCAVQTCTSPAEAGAFVAARLEPGALVLAKGSQNGVFAEEALKPLLEDPADQVKLVRQSHYWLSVKRKQFTDSALF